MNDLLAALGYLGDSLDKPGRALRGLLAGRTREGMAAVPFSDSLGLTDPADRVSGSDLLAHAGLGPGSETADALLGAGAEVALDPTAYLGTGLAARLGARAGRGLEAAAKARGPGYGAADAAAHSAGLADAPFRRLAERLEAGGAAATADELAHADVAADAVRDMLANAPGMLAEVPPGSAFIGGGSEGIAFRSPAGGTVRLGYVAPGEAGRPVADSVLQATRAVDFPPPPDIPYAMGYRAERAPYVYRAGDEPYWLQSVGEPGQTRIGAMRQQAAAEGLAFTDPHPGNLGLLNGRPVILDPGAVRVADGASVPTQDLVRPGEPSAAARLLLDLLGGQPAMRRSLDAGLAAPRYERHLAAVGGGAGFAAARLPAMTARNP